MPVTADRIVQQNPISASASVSGGTIAASLPSGVTAGNTVMVLVFCNGAGTLAETGWVRSGNVSAGLTRWMRGPTEGLAGGETSWTFDFDTVGTFGRPVVGGVFELEGVATTDETVTDASMFATDTSGTTAQLLSGQTSTYDGAVVCVHAVYDSTTTTAPTWSGHTGGFTEILNVAQAGASTSSRMSVSLLPVQSLGSFGADATVSRTLDATNFAGLHTVVLNAAGARKAANLYIIDGAEHGLATNNTVVAGHLATTMTAGVSVSSSATRSGNYGWRYSSTSAACNSVHGYVALAGMGQSPPLRYCFRFPTALPPNGTEIWAFSTGGGITYTFRHVSGGNIGLKIASGTEVVSDSTVTVNQWFAIDVCPDFRGSGSGTATARWSMDYNAELNDTTPGVAQTAPTGTGTLGGAISGSSFRFGWTTATTATMDRDDGVGSTERSHYPLGDIRVIPLKVDPSGTITISDGVTTNWGVTNNAGSTVSAWNATNARNAIDDVPPDLSGTRDGLVAVTASATAYVEIPAEPYDLAAQGVNVRGVRSIVSVGAASATAATMRLTGYDGVTTYTIYNELDPGADNTTAVWIAGQYRNLSRTDWTQQKVTDIALRFGSNDATPDIWLDCVVWELAVVKAQPETLFGAAPDLYVEAVRDPDSQALVGMTVNTPAGQPATVDYEINGTPGSTGSIAGGSSQYVPLSADGTIETVNKITMTPG